MYEQAVEKLTAEMAVNEKNPYVLAIGRYLQAHLEQHPEHAEKFLVDGKTIRKSLEAMRRYAQTKQFEGMAMVSDAEGYGIVLQYFECWDGTPFDIPPEPQPVPAKPNVTRQPAISKCTKPVALAKDTTKKAPTVKQLSLFGDEEEGGML